MPSTFRPVAWLCDAEWLLVYKKLFHGNSDDQKHALEIIGTWKTRFGSRIPVAIEATYRLFEAQLASEQNLAGCAQQIMSCAITQFLGIITEKHLRSENLSRKPIHVVAEELGIPEWVTDIRHDTTHYLLRSLTMCQNAVHFAINWIKEQHWDEQYKYMSKSSENEAVEDCEDLVDSFGSYTNHSMFTTFCETLKAYMKLSLDPESKSKLLKMVDTTNELLKSNESVVQVFSACLVNCGFIYYTKEGAEEHKPGKVDLFWKPMVMIMKNLGYLHIFLHCLVSQRCELDESELTKSKLLSKYAEFCVELIEADNPKNLLKKNDSLKVWKKLVRLLLLHQNDTTTAVYSRLRVPFIETILGKQTFEEVEHLQNLNNMQSVPSVSGPLCENGGDLLQDMSSKMLTSIVLKDSTKLEGSKWMAYEGKMLQNCRIGLLPNQDINTLSSSLFDSKRSCEYLNGANCHNQMEIGMSAMDTITLPSFTVQDCARLDCNTNVLFASPK